ncbi:MAG: TPM domain-containing protein [Acutalibacteraceae bacterium]|nr:TPM domain-containing protein [Acutalibacteraceae bacterium]
MKKLINIITAALAVCIFILPLSAANKYPKPTSQFFINDFAEVIEQSAEDEIYSKGAALQEKTTAQVVVVTVDTLDGEEPADYALELGREWGVGQEEEDNGVVILLAKTERQIYIAVGYGLEGALPDSKTGRIIDIYGLDYLKNNDFSNGLLEIFKAVVNEVYIEYGEEPEEGYTAIEDTNEETLEEYGARVLVSWVIMIAVVILFILIFGRRRRGFFWFGGPGGFGGGSGFGGFSGGSGGSFGGGFSGGGGSFGGGGAGRGF